jgi:hypothetical protein
MEIRRACEENEEKQLFAGYKRTLLLSATAKLLLEKREKDRKKKTRKHNRRPAG